MSKSIQRVYVFVKGEWYAMEYPNFKFPATESDVKRAEAMLAIHKAADFVYYFNDENETVVIKYSSDPKASTDLIAREKIFNMPGYFPEILARNLNIEVNHAH